MFISVKIGINEGGEFGMISNAVESLVIVTLKEVVTVIHPGIEPCIDRIKDYVEITPDQSNFLKVDEKVTPFGLDRETSLY